MKGEVVLVSGGAGYVGSHACKALAAAGLRPVVVDSLVRGHADAVKWGPLVEADISDGAALDRVFASYPVAVVLHLAAYAYVGESMADPEKYYLNNIGGTLSLLAAMRRAGVGAIVFSSSCATYGVPEALPVVEDTPQRPINPYGYSKLVIEQALRDYQQAYGLRWVALRYFNAAGCDVDGELGERHDPETHAIPLAIAAALGRGPAFEVMGTDYETPDGSAVRDYIHVADLADAHVRAVRHLADGGTGGAFNLGTGQGTSVLQLIAAVEKATGRKVPCRHSARRAGDPPVLFADARQAKRTLGWTPEFTDIDAVVRTAANWFMH